MEYYLVKKTICLEHCKLYKGMIVSFVKKKDTLATNIKYYYTVNRGGSLSNFSYNVLNRILDEMLEKEIFKKINLGEEGVTLELVVKSENISKKINNVEKDYIVDIKNMKSSKFYRYHYNSRGIKEEGTCWGVLQNSTQSMKFENYITFDFDKFFIILSLNSSRTFISCGVSQLFGVDDFSSVLNYLNIEKESKCEMAGIFVNHILDSLKNNMLMFSTTVGNWKDINSILSKTFSIVARKNYNPNSRNNISLAILTRKDKFKKQNF